MSVPNYLFYFVLGSTLAVVVALLTGIWTAVVKTDWSPPEKNRTAWGATFLTGGWLVAAVALAATGVYQSEPGRLPTVQYGLLTPIVGVILLTWLAPAARRILAAVPQSWVIGIQIYRVLGVIFLMLYAVGRLPRQFALPAGIGDVLVGLAAPLVALAAARRPRASRSLVAWWNVLGLTDLVVAVTTGVLTAPSPLQHLAFDHPNVLIALFPLVLIPTFLVPMAILLHIASLVKLWRADEVDSLSSGEIARSFG